MNSKKYITELGELELELQKVRQLWIHHKQNNASQEKMDTISECLFVLSELCKHRYKVKTELKGVL
jgi:hypothetical protein